MKPTCAIFTNIAPLYSRSLWHQLNSSAEVDYSFYSSKTGFSGIKTIDINESKHINLDGKLDWKFLRNIYIKNILVFQTPIISKCLSTDYNVYILLGEMYCISNWIAALICRIRKKPLFYWGHGLYGNEKRIKKFFRLLYYNLADYHLVYGERSRTLMINSGFCPDKVFSVYNSLDFNTHQVQYNERSLRELNDLKFKIFPASSELPVVLFIGRLTEEKKISLLLEALNECRRSDIFCNCLIVGDGDKREELIRLSESLGLGDSVSFYGSSYDEVLNSKLIMISECCVSPGNVGLTAIHSLSLGTPVITHSNFMHQGPEVEAVIQDLTGSFFKENDVHSLSLAITDMLQNKRKKLMEKNCIAEIKIKWNPKNQASIFDKAVQNSLKKQ